MCIEDSTADKSHTVLAWFTCYSDMELPSIPFHMLEVQSWPPVLSFHSSVQLFCVRGAISEARAACRALSLKSFEFGIQDHFPISFGLSISQFIITIIASKHAFYICLSYC